MIFYLDRSLTTINNANVNSHFIDLIENLCSARKNGRHIIYSEIPTIEHVKNLDNLSDRAKATLARVAKRVRGKLSIFNACSTYVKIVSTPNTFQKITLPDGKEEIQISSDSISGDDLFSKTRLLVENRTDGIFYGGIAKMSLHDSPQLQNVLLNYEIITGGGSQTPREYQNLKTTQNLTLCMVDSDVDYLGAPFGGNTAAPIYNMDITTPPVTARSLILNCYSAENLIHPLMLKHAMKLRGTEPWFIEINHYYQKDLWMFLALKSRKTCLDFSTQNDKTKYWLSKRSEFPTPPCAPLCIPASCSIFSPLHNTTLAKIATFLEDENYSFKSEITFNNHSIFSEWNSITTHLLSWACSGDRISTL
ncbi:hypothetical protein [Pseudomonas germanica]|uniref:Uncharacterized protein n=1 Tax=Pseudomonas germanica TaxID=2815720 RepID=A0ABX8YJL6_9PSED|nr:hypothetical protein [Pseudomonas germanica]QYY80084.1 hypothetical protein J0G10_20360 [Pseudomonas germanica]